MDEEDIYINKTSSSQMLLMERYCCCRRISEKATNYTTKIPSQRTGDYRPRRGRIQSYGATSMSTLVQEYAINQEATENNLSSLFTLSISSPPWLAISRQFRSCYLHPFCVSRLAAIFSPNFPISLCRAMCLCN